MRPDGALLDESTLMLQSVGAALPWLGEAEVLFAQGQGLLALDLVDRLLADMARFQLRPYRVDALFLRAKALAALGRGDEVRAALQAAREEAGALSSRRIEWRILAAMADLADEQGDEEAAQRLRAEARAVVGYIAEHTGSKDLRLTFLSQPAVRVVMAPADPEPGVAPQQKST